LAERKLFVDRNGVEPVGDFYDARPYEPRISSEGGYWL
jgi:hypothetical protein